MSMELIEIRPKRKFPDRFHTAIAARAEFFSALRHMPDDEYHAGRPVEVTCLYREGIEIVYRQAVYRIGGKPRPDRSWAVMRAEIEAAIQGQG